ncbi:MAG TPA: hypothetical protein VEH79_01680 [Gaiellaceae bacterium]|nr:hypothetical protein [Gaiellaceae bacterium]
MNRRLVIPMAILVVVIWLVGTWVTKYSLEQMALYAPLAVLVVGATAGLVLLWVKIALDSFRGRGGREEKRTGPPRDA